MSFLPLAACLLRLRCPDALRRLTGLRSAPVVAKPTSPGRRATSGLRHPRCTPPTSTFFPLLTFFSFLLYIPFFNSFSFFLYIFICTSFFSFSFYAYLYVYISPCFRNAAASTAANFISVHMLVCAFFFFFFCAVYAWLYISL